MRGSYVSKFYTITNARDHHAYWSGQGGMV